MAPSARHAQNLGQIIEYIPGTKHIRTTSYLPPILSACEHTSMSHCYPLPPMSQQNIVRWAVDCSWPIGLTKITDRLYLAAYIHPPSADTLFPYPQPPTSRKRAQRTAEVTTSSKDRNPPCYFTVDDTLLYNAFHHDFGPLHIGHLYRFAIQFHDILGAKENQNRPIVFWSQADPRSKSPTV